jgi:hypothetical protein
MGAHEAIAFMAIRPGRVNTVTPDGKRASERHDQGRSGTPVVC